MPSEITGGFILFSPFRVFHYVPLYTSLFCRFLVVSLLPQYHSAGFFHLLAAQLHLRSRVRNQAGDEIVSVIHNGGGVPVEVGCA